ncbi:MAG TPA: TonB family protein [Woeseiaceae bacterium]|nr:TonB family protein [Woeseiaceae bacterium]
MLALRLPVASGSGVLLTLIMFWALWSLINAPIDIGQRIVAPIIEFTPKIADSTPALKDRDRKKPELDIRQAPPQPDIIGVPGEKVRPARVRYERPPIATHGTNVDFTTAGGGTDADARPVVRIEPDYPPSALRRGIEGWVQVQFSVTQTGRVTDVFVINANPRGVFEEATIEAVRRWLYNPKIEDGVAVERVGLQTVLRFNID